MIQYLPYLGASISLLLGLIAVFNPKRIENFVSIQSIGREGLSEIRATYGGFFIGISLFALLSQNQMAFFALGVGWVCAAVIRLFTLLLGSYTTKNLGGVFFEAVIGLLCLSSSLIS